MYLRTYLVWYLFGCGMMDRLLNEMLNAYLSRQRLASFSLSKFIKNNRLHLQVYKCSIGRSSKYLVGYSTTKPCQRKSYSLLARYSSLSIVVVVLVQPRRRKSYSLSVCYLSSLDIVIAIVVPRRKSKNINSPSFTLCFSSSIIVRVL